MAGVIFLTLVNHYTMNTETYLKKLKEGAGHLNPMPVKTSENAPDYGGFIKIENEIYRLSAWVKNKDGKKYLSINSIRQDYQDNINNL